MRIDGVEQDSVRKFLEALPQPPDESPARLAGSTNGPNHGIAGWANTVVAKAIVREKHIALAGWQTRAHGRKTQTDWRQAAG